MEPGNLHIQHQFQEQCTGYSSSFSSLPAEYNNVSSTSDHFNPEAAGIILNISSNTHNNYLIDCIPNSCVSLPPVSLTQGLSFCQAFSFNQQSAASELLLGKTKEEFPDSFGKLSDMMHTSSNVEETDFLSSKYKHQYSHDLGGNQWPLNSFSSLRHLFYSNPQNEEYLQNLSACRGYNFSHFLPTINISNSDLCSSLVSSSLDLNLQTVDLLSTSSTCDGATSSSQSSENTLDHFMRELKDSPSNSYNKKSTFEDGYGRKKRPNSVSQSNNFLAEAKKNISDSATILPNFEGDDLKAAVRKEKLGDRIAALQWLVAPYGKTDTASVLTEAIGYIQFLHDQVQTLCAPPHMKSSDIKPTRTAQACSSEEDGKGQQKRDLRSRGLCLVPLSCVSFFRTCDGGIERSPRKELKMAYEKEI